MHKLFCLEAQNKAAYSRKPGCKIIKEGYFISADFNVVQDALHHAPDKERCKGNADNEEEGAFHKHEFYFLHYALFSKNNMFLKSLTALSVYCSSYLLVGF